MGENFILLKVTKYCQEKMNFYVVFRRVQEYLKFLIFIR